MPHWQEKIMSYKSLLLLFTLALAWSVTASAQAVYTVECTGARTGSG
jgi:hypothetical protein